MFGKDKEAFKEERVTLGKQYTDSITGFVGIAVSRTEFLYGCVRVGLDHKHLGEDKKLLDTAYFDEQRLLTTSAAKTGGPGDVPAAWSGEKK